jgi:hypothetical protein
MNARHGTSIVLFRHDFLAVSVHVFKVPRISITVIRFQPAYTNDSECHYTDKLYSYLKEGSLPEMFIAATMLHNSAIRFE